MEPHKTHPLYIAGFTSDEISRADNIYDQFLVFSPFRIDDYYSMLVQAKWKKKQYFVNVTDMVETGF